MWVYSVWSTVLVSFQGSWCGSPEGLHGRSHENCSSRWTTSIESVRVLVWVCRGEMRVVDPREGRWLGEHHEVRFCIYFNFLVIVIAYEHFQVLGPRALFFFLLRLSSRHLKNRERWLAPKASDRKILVPRSPALPEYTSLFFQILAKFTVTTVLMSTGVSLVLPEVVFFFGRPRFYSSVSGILLLRGIILCFLTRCRGFLWRF